MLTLSSHIRRGAARRTLFLAASAAIILVLAPAISAPAGPSKEELEGRAPTPLELQPGIEAAFPNESYAPGASASLRFFSYARGVTLQLFHTGPERAPTVGHNEMQGVPVTKPVRIGAVRTGRVVRIRIGDWASGVYFARVQAA